MALAALKLDIVSEVAIHNGEWYWYQLDRRLLGVHPEGSGGLMAAVKESAAAGLIEIRPNPALVDIPRYWLTDAGRAWLAEQRHAEQWATANGGPFIFFPNIMRGRPPLLSVAFGGPKWDKSMAVFEHGLDFRSLDDAVAYARLCLTAGYDRTGNWDLAQTCRHMTDWLRAPLVGPPPTPWLMKLPMAMIRLTLGPGILRRFLTERKMPAGMGTIKSTVHPPESDATAAVNEFAATAARFAAHTGP
jgi:hypothetical protein